MSERISRAILGGAVTLMVAIGAIGCDDGGTGTGGSGGSGGSGGAGAAGGGGSGGTGGTGATGGGGSGGSGGSGGGEKAEFAALVRGPLFTADMAEAKTQHDTIAAAGEAMAKAAGDHAHTVLLGTTLLGTTENGFLAMDRWDDPMSMKTFYENPDFQAAFATLFSAPPTLETFQRRPEWHTWGTIESGEPFDPYYWVVVRGHLAEADPAKAQAAHDAVAAGGEAQVTAAGDLAHVVFTGLADPQEFLAVDVWKSTDNMEAVYTNPDFQAAFGALFDGPPTVVVHESTDWHQW